jgi:ATP-binding cassette subfamily B protein
VWLRTDVRSFWMSARWALGVTWSTNAPLLAGVAAVHLIRGVLPAALALTARGLVNACVDTLRGSAPTVEPLTPWLTLGLALTVLEGLGQLVHKFLTQRLLDDLTYRVTTDVLTHAAQLDVATYDDPRFHDLLERAKQGPADQITSFIADSFGALGQSVQVATLLAVLAVIEPLILVVAVCFALPYFRFQWRIALRHFAIEQARTTKRRWSSYFVGRLTGRAALGETKILHLAPLLITKFRTLMAEFRDQDRALYLRGLGGGSLFVVLTTVAIYAMFLRVAWRVVRDGLTLGDLAIFGGAATRLRNALEVLVLSVSNAMERTLYIGNVIDFLRVAPQPAASCDRVPPAIRGDLVLEDVRFSYPGAAEPALDGISLHIRPGETVALVGENGAGKTTLVKLIARLYDADAGRLLFDGVDVRDWPRAQLYAQIAFVFQGFGRYEASAADNIAYGDWERLLADRDAVQAVAQLAGVDELIASLPAGYDTMLGREFGECDLSGGQWQKLAVARAFARTAALLILDEPTSNLDARAEYELFCRFQALAKGRTTIIVSHRFSTVSMADRIVVLDRGRVVETGTHDQLLARAGSYASLYALHQRRLAAG